MLTIRNHYVPQWYQKRFRVSEHESKLFYLDLKPEKVIHPDGTHHIRKAVRHLGPASCFRDDHLYTVNFGDRASDIIERRFFGEIDSKGARAVDLYYEYTLTNETHAAFNDLIRYMDAQKLRTPKGLAYLRSVLGDGNHQEALILMGKIWQAHITIWQESVWEVLSCDESPTKFIVTDNPVCTFNKGLFPASVECTYPNDPKISHLGTHTLFPLGLNRCLVITNLGYVRNPKAKPTRLRENPRAFDQVLFDLRKIQTGRQVSEDYVKAINFVLKNRARRYIAAAKTEWLYPEERWGKTFWSKIGGALFLMPDPRKVMFTTDKIVKFRGGGVWRQDEYGRVGAEGAGHVSRLRNTEWRSFQESKSLWDREFGALKPEDLKKYF